MLRPTRAGWSFFVLTFGVGFAALNTGNNLLYLVLSQMLAFLVLSGILSEAALRGIRVERELPRDIFAGLSPNRVLLHIHNTQPQGSLLRRWWWRTTRTWSPAETGARDLQPSQSGRAFALRIRSRRRARFARIHAHARSAAA